MAENEAGAAPTPPTPPQMKVLGQFIKDLSFENIVSRKPIQGEVQPDMQVQVSLDAKKRADNQYEPLSRPFDKEVDWQKLQTRQPWLPQEDNTLRQIIESQGIRAWSLVAKELNMRVHKGIPVRQGKQCRERYYNHIDPRLVKGNWTAEEDVYIMTQQQVIGNKWSKIAKQLPGRTENQVKNRFKSLLKRGASNCPRGLTPIENLLTEMKRSLDPEKLVIASPALSSTVTPSPQTPFSSADLNFSAWTNAFSGGMHALATPSPTTMLFFHRDK